MAKPSPAQVQLDSYDLKILKGLQADGRISNADLAEQAHLSPSACLRRLRLLEQRGIIEGYTVIVNHAAVGKPTNVFVEISLSSQSEECLDQFEEAVKSCPEIIECHLMSGTSDYLLRLAAASAEDYERIHRRHLSRLPHVGRLHSSFTLRTIIRNSGLPL